jgi:hypothetical protein
MKIAKVISEQEGLSPEKAQEIWDAFEKFGGYAFNKSHSVAYSLISYQSMWLKHISLQSSSPLRSPFWARISTRDWLRMPDLWHSRIATRR